MRIRTGYSFGTAYGDLERVLERLIECKYPAAPITDRNSTFGFARWKVLCETKGIKPIFGVELLVGDGERSDWWTFLAKDEVSDINRLVERAALKQGKIQYLSPVEANDPQFRVIRIIGERSPPTWLPETGATDDHYIGMSPSAVWPHVERFTSRGIKPIAISDNFYPYPEDRGQYALVTKKPSTQTYPRHILCFDELMNAMRGPFDDRYAARNNAAFLFPKLNAQLPRATLFDPKHTGKNLREMCEEPLRAYQQGMADDEQVRYWVRLDKELDLIQRKNFQDYFYVVADAVQWAKQHMLVGPARGSSCGSLVCFLLGITTVDPIKYDLLFERFMDENRDDLPDIDIDFSDAHRDKVFDYLEQKYGKARVARLGTVAYWRPRSILQMAGKAYGIPKWETDALAERETLKNIPQLSKWPKLHELEGHPRHSSSHAAGVILTNGAVTDFVAVDGKTHVTHCDKEDAEALGLLKIDALGLTQLSVFEDALVLAGLPRDRLDTVGFNDPAAFAILNDRKYNGIFQFNGRALQGLAGRVKVGALEDIVALTALARPGPLDSGAAQLWMARRNGENYINNFPGILDSTYGVIVYQEQVMKIARDVGNFSWPDVGAFRRAMSKSKGVEQFRDKFLAQTKLPPREAERTWEYLETFGAYGFNRSHSVAYAIISYWCCWLKAHYPLEFACATLIHEPDSEKQAVILRELAKEGIGYKAVDPVLSGAVWSIDRAQQRLVGPLSNIEGMGPKTMSSILGARARGEKIPDRAQKLLAKPTTPIDTISPVADRINTIDLSALKIASKNTPIESLLPEDVFGDYVVFGVADKITQVNENEPKRIERRKGKILPAGADLSLAVWLRDDTGKLFAKIPPEKFASIGHDIIQRGKAKKAIYAMKGFVRAGEFRMLYVNAIRFLGEL